MKGTGQTPIGAVIRVGSDWYEFGIMAQPVHWYIIVRRPQGSSHWEQAPEWPRCFSHRHDAGRELTRHYPFPSCYLSAPLRALANLALKEALQGGAAG